MNSATFKVLRKTLGLSHDDVANAFGLSSTRTVQRWESTKIPPENVVEWMHELWDRRMQQVAVHVQLLENGTASKDLMRWWRWRECREQLDMSLDEQDAYLGMVFTLAQSRGVEGLRIVDRDPDE